MESTERRSPGAGAALGSAAAARPGARSAGKPQRGRGRAADAPLRRLQQWRRPEAAPSISRSGEHCGARRGEEGAAPPEPLRKTCGRPLELRPAGEGLGNRCDLQSSRCIAASLLQTHTSCSPKCIRFDTYAKLGSGFGVFWARAPAAT